MKGLTFYNYHLFSISWGLVLVNDNNSIVNCVDVNYMQLITIIYVLPWRRMQRIVSPYDLVIYLNMVTDDHYPHCRFRHFSYALFQRISWLLIIHSNLKANLVKINLKQKCLDLQYISICHIFTLVHILLPQIWLHWQQRDACSK